MSGGTTKPQAQPWDGAAAELPTTEPSGAQAEHFMPFRWRAMPGGSPLAEQVAFADRAADVAAGPQVLAQVFEADALADPDPVMFAPGHAGRLRRLSVTVLGMLAAEARSKAEQWEGGARLKGGAA
ncbi:MAG: hypothetical protein RLZZ182_673 [Pseudomonadota bacterium]|jgi:hypothetical protein